MMGLTKIDVAKLAGVSHMTVTRVLRNDACVSQDAKKRVMDACFALDYRHNMAAATVRGGRSFAFGVVLAKLKHTFYARFLDSLETECAKMGCHIIAIQGVDEFFNMIRWEEINFLLSRQIDGLFVMSPIKNEICRKIVAEKIPSVYLDSKPDISGVNFIGTSDRSGFRTITDLIISKGHKKIAFIGGKKDSYTSKIRFQGFKESLKNHKIAFNEKLAAFAQNYDTRDGFSAAEALLLSGEKFTAVACANDYIAIGAISAFAKHGIPVPEQISVTG
ncbi:MAG: LacI family DNA-binding transcriptional regulator, partial [Victivallales bacterium]